MRNILILTIIVCFSSSIVYSQKKCDCNKVNKTYLLVLDNFKKGEYMYPAEHYEDGINYETPKVKINKHIKVLISLTSIEPENKSESYTYSVSIEDINLWGDWINKNCDKKYYVEKLKPDDIDWNE